MANGYGAGFAGGPGSPVKKKRNLEKVPTFAELGNNQQGPSMQQGPGFQPGGFGPGPGIRKPIDRGLELASEAGQVSVTPTTPGYTSPGYTSDPYDAGESEEVAATSRDYSEAGSFGGPGFGPPAGGFGAGASPWFGAGIPDLPSDTPFVPSGAEAAEGEEAGLGTGFDTEEEEQDFGDLSGPGEIGDLGTGIRERQESAYEVGGAQDPGADPSALGFTEEEQRGLVYADPQTAGVAGAAAREQQEVDEEFEGLLDDLSVGEENARNQLDAAFAKAARRNAEANAAMGSSVAGGFAGATAQTTLDYLQQMQNMYADFQTRRTDLQLQWLDKKRSMDFQREMQDRQDSMRLIEHLLATGQEVDEELWAKAYGAAGEAKRTELTGYGAGDPEDPGAIGEAGSLKNEAGDLYMGSDGLGTSGEIQANPWDTDSESHQWYGRSTGQGRYEYYRIDENGNEVAFEPGVDGGRWPGDVSLIARAELSGDREIEYLDPAKWGAYQIKDRVWQHPDSGYPTTFGAGEEFLERMATRIGYEDHASMFGQGIGDEWKITYAQNSDLVPNPDDAEFGGGVLAGNAINYRGDNMAVRALVELSQFVSLYRGQNDGDEPSDSQIYDHLRKAGVLPYGTPGANPFSEEDI